MDRLVRYEKVCEAAARRLDLQMATVEVVSRTGERMTVQCPVSDGMVQELGKIMKRMAKETQHDLV